MKTILFLIFCFAFLWFCNMNANQPEVKAIFSVTVDTLNYQMQIQPIFEKDCSPCHFSGGKMYDKMPFDKGETIINHEGGILKRIKDEKDVALIKEYILQQSH
jgi:hypothetical protein